MYLGDARIGNVNAAATERKCRNKESFWCRICDSRGMGCNADEGLLSSLYFTFIGSVK